MAWAIAGPVVGWSFVGTGLYAWRRRPESRIGLLMVLLGFAWFISTLATPTAARPRSRWSRPAVGRRLPAPRLWFPDGRLQTRGDRALVIAGYVIFPLAFVPARGVGAALYAALFVVVLVRSARTGGPRTRSSGSSSRRSTCARCSRSCSSRSPSAGARRRRLVGRVRRHRADAVRVPRRAAAQPRLAPRRASCTRRMEELRASRARLVEAGDAARRRLERDLHDGAQSRLVALALLLRTARSAGAGRRRAGGAARPRAGGAADEPRRAARARARHPPGGADRARARAGAAVARRARAGAGDAWTPTRAERLPAPVESAAYFVVSEALANVAKYAQATQASVAVGACNGRVTVEVADDGVGGADAARGSGLRGLADRVAALDGTLTLDSPAGRGTRLRAEIPVA